FAGPPFPTARLSLRVAPMAVYSAPVPVPNRSLSRRTEVTMRRHLPLFALLLLVAVPALAQDKPIPARPSAAAVVDFRVFRYETIDGWKAAIDLGGLWRPHPESRQSFGGMLA